MPELKKPFPTPIKIQSEPKWLKPLVLSVLGLALAGVVTYLIIQYPKWIKAREVERIRFIVQVIDKRVGPVLIKMAKEVEELKK